MTSGNPLAHQQAAVGVPSAAGTVVPSPFETSAAGVSRWSFKAAGSTLNILLRALILLFSFASALSLAAPQTGRVSLLHHREFKYCMSASVTASVYSAFQLFKGICDVSFNWAFISDKKSDYISFAFDQVMAYLLMSSSSVCILGVTAGRIALASTLHAAAAVASALSFAACLGFTASALLSGYRLCTRIIW